jgi:TolA-binding protein
MSQVLHKTTLGRASRTLGQLWQVPMFCIGLFAVAFVAVSAPLRQDPLSREFDENLNQLRQVLNQKREKAQTHLAMVEKLLERAVRYPSKAGEVHYLAGMLYARLANEGPPEEASATRDKAVRHLDEALGLGVPEPDLPFLEYRLGSLLHMQGGDLRRVIQLLSHSIEQQPLDQRGPGYGMLVQAYLKLPQPQLDAALDANENHLSLMEYEEEPLMEATLLRGELLIKRGRRQDAAKWLERINAKAPRAFRVKARLLQIQCYEEEERWKKAIPLWQELLPDCSEIMGDKGRILYSIGLCYYRSDSPDYEAAQKAWQETRVLGGDFGQAANIRLAEILLFGPKTDAGAAFTYLNDALKHVRSPAEYLNKVLDVGQVRELFQHALERYRSDANMCQNLAALYGHVAPAGTAQMFLARSAEDLARDFKSKYDKAEQAKDPQRQSVLAEARSQYRQAGELYEIAAQALKGPEQANALYLSARCYVPGEDYARAIAVLQRFVKSDSSDSQKAQAYLDLGDSHRQLNQIEQATAAYFECIKIPQTPCAVRARYQLALIQITQGKKSDAKENLQQILAEGRSGIAKETLELALFKLADLLFDSPELSKNPQPYEDAQWRLEEALRTYSFSPQVWRVRDQLGFCYRQQARFFADQYKITKNPDLLGHQKKSLENAARTYQPLADELQKRFEKGQLSPNEAAWLRRTRMTLANVHVELELHAEAFRLTRDIAESCRQTKEGLEAVELLGKCLSVLEQMAGTLESTRNGYRKAFNDRVNAAIFDLNTMVDSHPVFQPPGRPRQQWLNDLGRMRGSNPAAGSRPN